MEKIHIVCPVSVLNYSELSPETSELVKKAREMTVNSYAPYSHFNVGAAIQLDNGEIVTGANQENVAYPSGTCAERSACYYAHARYPKAGFTAIAIAARGTDGEFVETPVSPCGACRQALLEYEILSGHDIKVILVGRDKVFMLPSVTSLLPLAFTDF